MFKIPKIHFLKIKKPVLWEENSVRNFYLLQIFSNGWFIKAAWVLWFLKFFSYGEFGFFDSMAFLFGFFLEIPSGAIADIFGRKKTMIFGFFTGILGAIFFSISLKSSILIGNFLIQFTFAFLSRTIEAYLFNSLKQKGLEKSFDEVISNSGAIARAFPLFYGLFGGFLYKISPQSSFILWEISYLIGFLISLKISEPQFEKVLFSLKNYIFQIVNGFKNFLNKQIWILIPCGMIISGIFYFAIWGFFKFEMMIEWGLDSRGQSILFTISSIVGVFFIKNFSKIRKKFFDEYGFLFLNFLGGTFFILSGVYFTKQSEILVFANIFFFVLIFSADGFLSRWLSFAINNSTKSKDRATTILTFALFQKFPYVVLTLIGAFFVDMNKLSLCNNSGFCNNFFSENIFTIFLKK